MTVRPILSVTSSARTLIRDTSSEVVTRFPPEPNGYLHIGHAKSICSISAWRPSSAGSCNLRIDDTNPVKEERRIHRGHPGRPALARLRLGRRRRCIASDYFEQLYAWAEHLIENGKPMSTISDADEIREYRGTLKEPGKNSPHRDRSVEENLDLFRRMRAGEFPNGAKDAAREDRHGVGQHQPARPGALPRPARRTIRAPATAWCIYPTYDFAHGQSDAIEGVTHSMCTLEFADHRPLYDWLIEHLPTIHAETVRVRPPQPHAHGAEQAQADAAGREGHRQTAGTIRGCRRFAACAGAAFRRGALREFAQRIGVARADSVVEYAFLETLLHARTAQPHRAAAHGRAAPAQGRHRELSRRRERDARCDQQSGGRQGAGTRQVVFSRELYIERDDFMEDPPKKFFRLGPGREVRLRYAYYVTCTDVIKDDDRRDCHRTALHL